MKKYFLLIIISLFFTVLTNCNPCCNRILNGRLLLLQSTVKSSGAESTTIQMCVPLNHASIAYFKEEGTYKFLFDVDSSCKISNVQFFGRSVEESETQNFRSFFSQLDVDFYINDVKQTDCSALKKKEKILGKLIIGTNDN